MEAGYAKVFWVGRHAHWSDSSGRSWSSPVGRLQGEQLEVLTLNGWKQVHASAVHAAPCFSLSSRHAGDFAAGASHPAPFVRPFDAATLALLDDKWTLYESMRHVVMDPPPMPATYSAAQFAALDRSLPDFAFCASEPTRVWFVKHRLGAKGLSVYPHIERSTLDAQLQKILQGNGDHWIVQLGVPPCLQGGRAFCLRVHVLFACRGAGRPYEGYMHEDVIVLQHSREYARCRDAAAHVQQLGRSHPPPQLLHAFDAELGRACFPRLREISRHVLAAQLPLASRSNATQSGVLYALFGLDFAIDVCGRAMLLEVNAFPAIRTGSMKAVSNDVFSRLVSDLLGLLVLPEIHDSQICKKGGFLDLEIQSLLPMPAVARIPWPAAEQAQANA
jgi:hypothetical protein